jgi:hypothetical protein
MNARWRSRAIAVLAVGVLSIAGIVISREVRSPALDASATETYCSLFLDLEGLRETAPSFEEESNADQSRTSRQMARSARPLVVAVDKVAPPAISGDANVLLRAVDEVAQTGNFSILGLRGGDAPQAERHLSSHVRRIRAAVRRVHAYNLANCGWSKQKVLARDNAYVDAPSKIASGITSFEFTNDDRAPHELVIERLNRRVSVRQILHQVAVDEQEEQTAQASGDGGAAREVTQLAPNNAVTQLARDKSAELPPDATSYMGEAFTPGHKSDYVVLDLKPGRYVMLDFIPVGSVYVNEQHERLGTGTPHALLGMIHLFTVG